MHGEAARPLGRITVVGILALCTARTAIAQLNENCTVSVLNRNVRVNPDGSWVLPNVPANLGPVRARVTCIADGRTTSGESALFVVPPDGVVNIPPIVFGNTTAIPSQVTVAAATGTLTQVGEALQLTVTARYAGGSAKDVTDSSTGTKYTISNAAIATVSGSGLVQAVRSGTVLIQATHEGTSGLISILISLAGADTDGDGIPDDIELSLGSDPRNPVDAAEDFDRDGLTNLQEYLRGTEARKADTDGDNFTDGQEIARGTNPLLRDTDGDGLSDGLEVQTGSDPLDSSNFNLAAALTAIAVAPAQFLLTFNTITGEAFHQLTVTGTLLDGTAIDLTSTARGTNYSSSDLAICSFGATAGRVFAGSSGACTVTVTVGGFSGASNGVVRTSAPTPLSFVSIPGFANNVDVNGNFAYVAAGAAGLQVVDVSDRRAPHIIGALDTPGNANDVKVVGGLAYVADGSSGLQIVDISTPSLPRAIFAVDTPGDASDIAVSGALVFVADGGPGLQVIDATTPASARVIGSVTTSRPAKGVDISGGLAAVAIGSGGVEIVDIANPVAPLVLGRVDTPGDARDVVVVGSVAYVADYTGSLQVASLIVPSAPVILATTPPTLGGYLMDLAVSGSFVIGADVLFVNGVPIVEVGAPANPVPRAILDFSAFRDDNGTGIAVDGSYVYLTASRGIEENGASEDTRLYIGQYRALEDVGSVAPTVTIASPAPGATFVEAEAIPFDVVASDDVAVSTVSFLVNGSASFIDTTAPYQFAVVAPVGVAGVTLSATALDLGGNIGSSPDVFVTVVPDPKTSVIGRVIDANSVPIPGANVVTSDGLSATTGADGRFTINNVPTIARSVVVRIVGTTSGQALVGQSSSVLAVRGGVTDVGDVLASTCLPLTLDLAGWWPGDGDARDAGGFNHGTPQNGATFATGLIGDAFSFDGIDDAIVSGTPPFTSPSNTFTIEFWALPTATRSLSGSGYYAGIGQIFGAQRYAIAPEQRGAGAGVGVSVGTNGIGIYEHGDNFIPSVLAYDVQLSGWNHIAVVYTNRTPRLYLNGVLVAVGVPSERAFVYPSKTFGDTSNGYGAYKGLLDEVAIHDRALGVDEIRTIATVGRVGICRTSAFDASFDYSRTANPNGVWTFGASTVLGAILPYTRLDAGGVSAWRGAPGIPESLGAPTVAHNDTGSQIGLIPAGQLAIHPGPDGEFSVVRWTAPAAGEYQITVRFSGGDYATTDVHVVHNDQPLFAANINGQGDTKTYNARVIVAAGDTIDFAVGAGGNSFFSDTTLIDARVTLVGVSPP